MTDPHPTSGTQPNDDPSRATDADRSDGGEQMGNYYTGGKRVPGPHEEPSAPAVPAGAFGAPEPDQPAGSDPTEGPAPA